MATEALEMKKPAHHPGETAEYKEEHQHKSPFLPS
jgi:hypothetical protein